MPTEKQLAYWQSMKGKASNVKKKHWKLSEEAKESIRAGRIKFCNSIPKRVKIVSCCYCSKVIKRYFSHIYNNVFCSKSCLGKYNSEYYLGENAFNWKGKKAGYRAIHIWVEKLLGKPRKCEHCGNNKLKHRQYNWANISREYKRLLTDWIRLCVKCHKAFDAGKVSIN